MKGIIEKGPNIVQALQDKLLFGSLPAFASLSWRSWLVWLKAVFALPLEEGELETFRQCTGRSDPPTSEPSEIYTIVGRRGGKSFICALVAVYIAAFRDFKKYLNIGERPHVLVLARDREQAQVVFRYVVGILEAIPVLAAMIAVKRADEIELVNRVIIRVATSDYRHVRGSTVACCIADEACFWDSQGVNPDSEIFTALRPSMLTIPGSKLLVISTPYAKTGTMFEAYRKHFGVDDPRVLVWQAPTTTMNPRIPQAEIDAAIESDPAGARSEYLAIFREDIEACFPLSAIEPCVVPGRVELAPAYGRKYFAFVDPSGGRGDRFTLAVGHAEKGICIVDLLWAATPPFSPTVVVAQIAEILARYKITKVTGDDYGAEMIVDQFKKHRIQYESYKQGRSQLYLNLIPTLCSQQVELLDHKKLVEELRRLERRRGRSGRDTVDHPSGGSDDHANAVAGLVHIVGAGRKRLSVVFGRDYDKKPTDEPGTFRVGGVTFVDRTGDGYTGFARGGRPADVEQKLGHRHDGSGDWCYDSPCEKPNRRK